MRTAAEWLALVQTQLARGDAGLAYSSLHQALIEQPASIALRRAQAGVLARLGRDTEAESTLRGLLGDDPHDAASAFALAHLLKDQARTSATASTLRACLDAPSRLADASLAIRAIELLDDCGRKLDASMIARDAISANPADARLHAYAGMLAIQLGQFDNARKHYLFALENDARALEWHVPIGLSATRHYTDAAHSDLALFLGGLKRTDISPLARAELHFALGKARDDLGEWADATTHFREGNAIRHRTTAWSRKAWRRFAESRLASRPFPAAARPTAGFTPIFIVGMPRTGTTLLAELLSRHPDVRNRGELPLIAKLAAQPGLDGGSALTDLERAAAIYAAHARQDDAPDARWFIDKQPLNFRYVDLMLSMFPDARVIHCRRNERDTALSLWTQCFLEDVQGYAYDFGDIALVMHDCARLMARWNQHHAESIQTIEYEMLVTAPHMAVAKLARWIGLRDTRPSESPIPKSDSTISTASLWQARQPINTQSVGRWQRYAGQIPELSRFRG